MKIFVPGRICLFGEHSDWAGGYRRINADIEKGHAIITGTNQGIHARVKPHRDSLVLRSVLPDGTVQGPHRIPMEKAALLDAAERGGTRAYLRGHQAYCQHDPPDRGRQRLQRRRGGHPLPDPAEWPRGDLEPHFALARQRL